MSNAKSANKTVIIAVAAVCLALLVWFIFSSLTTGARARQPVDDQTVSGDLGDDMDGDPSDDDMMLDDDFGADPDDPGFDPGEGAPGEEAATE